MAIQVLLIPPIPPLNKDETKSLGLALPIEIVRVEPNGVPLMSRMLEARAEIAVRPTCQKVKDIFGFDTAEEEKFFDAVDAGTVEVSQLLPSEPVASQSDAQLVISDGTDISDSFKGYENGIRTE
ncbi:hypothetical protein NEUTE1DRAFT_139268 [Neurospora tetrasperma FGSC 2508]|uniref:Uncharacterized protein n=1 Tax=Neurospora tetrasperma (strain FGSC 2508 / ATCC MYA-4615 / P0657) TaxID=510951 RepID=F8MRZ1_NEUT8|nr:uncharacterized protein NEUTE1DRAFT_139268 [Neurospora tetrasperma FGSC 2508]EGO54985.1 hypothetical protein NEUTE1DRAFT_139268 [Neurospora tetrasperma FGSC 2508]